MIYKVQDSISRSLLDIPETGMGYQIIEAKRQFKSYSEQFIVYNSELVLDLDSNFLIERRKVATEGYMRMFSSSNVLNLSDVKLLDNKAIHIIDTKYFSAESQKQNFRGRNTGVYGAKDSYERLANGLDEFVRLSAYENDKRIDFEKKRLRNGSYTTTIADYKSCKDFLDNPVDRYALPNDESIKWAFYFKPKANSDKYKQGVVQPANNHSGGGIEALFENGTSDNTYLRKTTY